MGRLGQVQSLTMVVGALFVTFSIGAMSAGFAGIMLLLSALLALNARQLLPKICSSPS